MSEGSPRAWAAGMQVGRSVLQRVIARGGMAEIWLAQQVGPREFSRDVVIKRILLPGLGDSAPSADLERQFFDEARLASQLTHPNIVQVYEFDEFEGTPYLVMESLVGETLAGLMRTLAVQRAVMPAPLAVAIIDRCAQALGSAHRKVGVGGAPLHIVHRDVSPQNIFVTREGIVKVLDFGIARAVGRVTNTAVGVVRGKPAYMAPEQALSEADAASDVFALGVVLFELLTGTRLYGDVDVLTAFAKLVSEEPFPTPSSVNPSLPAGLDALVARMLARSVAERFVDGVACADALAEWQWTNHGPVSEQALSEWLKSLDPASAVTLPAAPAVQLPDSTRRGSGSDAASRAAPLNATVVASPGAASRRSAGSDAAARAASGTSTVVEPGASAPRRGQGSNATARAASNPGVTREAPLTVAPTLVLSDAEPVAAPVPAAPPSLPTPRGAPSTPKPRRSKWLLFAGVLVSVVAVGGFVAARKADETPGAPPSPAPGPPAALVPTPPPPSPPAPPATLELRLSSKPDAAQVEVDGLLVGHTPLVVTGREGAMVEISLTAPGFSKLERRVLLSRQLRELTLELEKPRAAPRSPGKPTEKQKPGLYDNPWE